jgi:hypothetical protein
MKRGLVLSLIALTAIVATNDRARSDGAIAIGVAPGGVASGYASAVRVGRPDSASAQKDVLAECRKRPEHVASGAAPNITQARARERCKVVATFKDKCAALALDPKDGTPGAGWGTGETQEQADQAAVARCRSSAGKSRREFCKLTTHLCDGTAK